MRIAVYTIALNEEKHVKRWFQSAKDADLLLIADTGSSDSTVELARSMGIQTYSISVSPWRFDHARNASLALVSTDIDLCIQLDMDEVLPPGWRQIVETAWLDGNHWPIYKHVTSRYRDGRPRTYQNYFKIHPRHGFSWKYPIHEILVHDVKLNYQRRPINLEVDHIQDTGKSRNSYLGLLEMAVSEEPFDWRMNHYLNREYYYSRDWLKVLQTGYACERISGGWDVERASTYMWTSEAAHHLGLKDLAQQWAEKASVAAPHFYEAWHWRAHIAHLNSNWDECKEYSFKRLELTRQEHHLVKPEVWEWWGYDLMALSSHRLGLDADAIKYGELAIAGNPADQRLKRNMSFYEKQYQTSLTLNKTQEEFISLITPTRNRKNELMEQYKRIINSTHQNWEWLIFDDSDEPISEIENIPDSRIRIFKESAASNLSIGAKRNFLILQARGEYIAHIDDDDIYSNNYLTAMLNDLLSNSASLHYLNSWIALRKDDQSYWAYTSSCMLPVIEGWGFTFFYRKELGLRIKFPEDNWEAHGWLQKVIDANIDCSHSDDTERLVIKIIHDRNTSRFPWHLAKRLSD